MARWVQNLLQTSIKVVLMESNSVRTEPKWCPRLPTFNTRGQQVLTWSLQIDFAVILLMFCHHICTLLPTPIEKKTFCTSIFFSIFDALCEQWRHVLLQHAHHSHHSSLYLPSQSIHPPAASTYFFFYVLIIKHS